MNSLSSRRRDARSENAQTVGAFVGMVGGVMSALIGSGLTVASWFMTNEGARAGLSTTGAVILFMTIPLLILGGYCLDGIDKKAHPDIQTFDDGDRKNDE